MKPPLLINIAEQVRTIVQAAEAEGVRIDDGNVVDLIADNITRASLSDIRSAIVVAGYSARFPKATSKEG
jgi:hypothetical protein